MTTNQTAPVTDEELDHLIWGIERYGLYHRQLAALKELREVRRAKGESVSAITPHFDTIALETATEIMCDVNRRNEFLGGDVQLLSRIQCRIDDACRAAMLNHSGDTADMVEPVSNRDELPTNSFTNEDLAGMAHGDSPQANAYRELLAFRRNSPATPDGWVMVPMKLTAENGAKAALIGEFNLEYTLTCHECFGEGCDDCSGEGAWINTIPIDWTTIKEIWAKGVEHFSVAPQEAKGE